MTTWAYDIETANWDELLCAVAVSETGETRIMRTDAECAHWYHSLPVNDTVIAHNGGRFDFLQLIAACEETQFAVTAGGSGIIECHATDGRYRTGARMVDSYRVFALSLAKWTGAKTTLPWADECICTRRKCGGYCLFSRDMPRERLGVVIDYCVNDARILLATWLADLERLEADGLVARDAKGVPLLTFGQVAWQSARDMADIPPNERPEYGDYIAGRSGYYGGKTEVGAVRADHGYRYDIHSAYPWALTLPVPVGKRYSVTGVQAIRAYANGDDGIYDASVYLPECSVTLLPHRYDGPRNGVLTPERLLWTNGHVRGSWTGIELRYAERHGAVILAVDSASLWDAHEPIYAPYVETVYAARRRALDVGDERWGNVIKWFANALSGKLAQRPSTTRITILPRGECPKEDDAYTRVGEYDTRVWARTVDAKLSTSARSWQAATLTSRVREKLGERLLRHGDSWLYCDTDSTYLTHADTEGVHASELGAWGFEGELTQWECLAPKLYRFRYDGGEKVRARGVPAAIWDDLDALRARQQIAIDVGVKPFKTSGGRFERRTVRRSHHAPSDLCGTRRVLADGRTRPLYRTIDGDYR